MAAEQGRTRDPERKDRILTAAASLIGRNGFHAVSMSEIGSEAGITGSGIYRHFDGKSAILIGLFDAIIDNLMTSQAAILGEATDVRRQLHRLVTDQVEFVVGDRHLAQVYYNEIQSLPGADRQRLRRKQRLYLEEWVHLVRESRPDLDDAQCRVLVHAAIGAIQSTLFHNVGLEESRLKDLLVTGALAVLCVDLSRSDSASPHPFRDE